MSSEVKVTDLKRTIGFWGGTAIVVGCVIGSGIFRTPSSIAHVLQDPPLIIALWIGAGLLCLCGALTLAELGTMMPKTGGTYVFLRAAYGDAAAFTFGWLYIVAAIPSGLAALAAFFGELILHLYGIEQAAQSGVVIQIIASAMLIVLSLINIRGVELGTFVQTSFTVIKTIAVALVIFVAFILLKGQINNFAPVEGGVTQNGGFYGLAAAVAFVFWTYNGWVYIGYVAGELENPEKRIKPILITGVLIIMSLYVLANLAYLYIYPIKTMTSKMVAQDLVSLAFGPAGGFIVSLAIIMSVFGATNGTILTNSRVAYAMSRDSLTFSFLGHVNPRWATPDISIIIQGTIAVLMVNWLGNYEAITSYFVVVEWSALIFTIAAVYVLRKKLPNEPRPYHVPGYPWIPLIFVVGTSLGLTAIVLSRIKLNDDYDPLFGLIIAALGFPIYYIWQAIRRKRTS